MVKAQPCGANEDAAPPPPPLPDALSPLVDDEVPVGESLPPHDVAPRPAPTRTTPSATRRDAERLVERRALLAKWAVFSMVCDVSKQVEPGANADANGIAVTQTRRVRDARRRCGYARGARPGPGGRDDGGRRRGSIEQ